MATKICNSCKKEKDLKEFRRDARLKDGHQGRCKKCTKKAIKKAWPTKYRAKSQQLNERKRNEYKQNMEDYLLDKSCEHCGEVDPITFDFHHADPAEKEYEITAMKNFSWDRILEEIKKCSLLCSNCHRKEHRRLRQEKI